MLRTHTCGQLRKENNNETVTLAGWVDKVRTHGHLTFIDLRDRYGTTQITIENLDQKLGKEDVIQVAGKVIIKPEPNKALKTGEIEIKAEKLTLLNKAKPLPLDITNKETTEETRLKYRYLDLRSKDMQQRLMLRHKATTAVREYFDKLNFIEIETPILGKSTPEGARDYLVPSRVHNGEFYALPQSPQIFKQLFQVAGLDRYMQIVKCFRDEDLRADRQPEFTQIDLEMSFVEEEDIYEIMEGMTKHVWKKALNVDIKTPFPRMTYKEAMLKYGSDKPDLRFGLEIKDLTQWAKQTDFNVFKNAPCTRALVVNGEFSRKKIDKLTDLVKIHKAKGLAWLKKAKDGFEGGIAKFIKDLPLELKENEYIFFVADEKRIVESSLGALRSHLGKELNLIKGEWNFLWVTEFPMLEYSEEEEKYVAMHHPFTSVLEEDRHLLQTKPEEARSRGYDLVLNGFEIGGGSIRIHDRNLQEEVFAALNISKEEQQEKFGFLLNALSYGAPPHAGLAFGFDRLVMLLAKAENIREVIAFPKTKDAQDLMMRAPSKVKTEQLDELGIKTKE